MSVLKIATYNIFLSLHAEEIVENIKKMAGEGVSLFALQEITRYKDKPFIGDSLLDALGRDWKIIYSLPEVQEKNFCCAILWNTKKLNLVKSKRLNLPEYIPGVIEKLYSLIYGSGDKSIERSVISGEFLFNGKPFAFSSVHLDALGGAKHRAKQLNSFMPKRLQKEKEIICGDFNTSDFLNTKYEVRSIAGVFGDFKEATRLVGWTFDYSRVNLDKAHPLFRFLVRLSRVHVRRKLDYVWVKEAKVLTSEILRLSGSDHSPIVVSLVL